jgi:hypothetical protein
LFFSIFSAENRGCIAYGRNIRWFKKITTPKDKTACVMCKSTVCSHISVVKYQCTLIGQALHNCLPSKESPAKRAICHCPDTKLSEKRNRKRSKNW